LNDRTMLWKTQEGKYVTQSQNTEPMEFGDLSSALEDCFLPTFRLPVVACDTCIAEITEALRGAGL